MADSYRFHFYVTSSDEKTLEVARQMEEALSQKFEGMEFEIKNLFEGGNAADALQDGVFSVPSLVKKMPEPIAQVIADFDNNADILIAVEKLSDSN